MRVFKFSFPILFLLLLPFIFASCDEEPSGPNNNNGSSSSSTGYKKEVNPEIKIITSAATKDDFTVSFRVKSANKPQVTLHWSSHSSSTSNPSLSKSSTVTKTYDIVESKSGYSWWYYKVTHAGFSPGQYVYYQVEATNSAGSTKSSIGHVIIKR